MDVLIRRGDQDTDTQRRGCEGTQEVAVYEPRGKVSEGPADSSASGTERKQTSAAGAAQSAAPLWPLWQTNSDACTGTSQTFLNLGYAPALPGDRSVIYCTR